MKNKVVEHLKKIISSKFKIGPGDQKDTACILHPDDELLKKAKRFLKANGFEVKFIIFKGRVCLYVGWICLHAR